MLRIPYLTKSVRSLGRWLALPLCCIPLGACHGAHAPEPVIAIFPKSTSTVEWKTMHAAVLQAARDCGCRIEWTAPESEADYPQQASMVEAAVAQHVSGIILAPSHQLVLASSVRRATRAGIPVVIIDSPIALPAGQYAAMIGFSDEEIGFLAADRIGELLHGSGEVGVIGVSPTVQGSSTREAAFEHELQQRDPGVHVVDVEYGLSDLARSSAAAEDLLARYPGIQAIFASDSFAASGTEEVLRGYPDRHVLLVAVGQEGDILNGIRDGLVDSTVVKDSYAMGDAAMKAMEDIFAHRPVRAYTGLPVRLITRTDVDAYRQQQARILHELVLGHRR